MKFLLLFKGQSLNDALELGDRSFNTFYGEVGLKALYNILDSENAEQLVEKVLIKDEKSKEYSVPEFFDILDTLKLLT